MSNVTKKIDKNLFDEISSLISKGAQHGNDYIMSNYNDSSGDDYAEYMAQKYLYSAWRHLITALEIANLQFLCDEAKKLYEDFKKEPLDSAMGPEEPYLIWPSRIEECLRVVRTFCESSHGSDKELFDLKKILENCETVITDKQIFAWLPCEEADVHIRLENILKCYWPDLEHKPGINHAIKKFQPDTGIEKLKTFVEYKYVTSREDCARVLDEIYADINGYQHKLFQNIVFVIYETNRCFLESEWESSLKTVETKMNCDFLLLKGLPPTPDDLDIRSKNVENVKSRKRKAKDDSGKRANQKK